MKKQYVGISRDHSGSMSSLRGPAAKDYNESVSAIKQAALENGIETRMSVTSCGIRNGGYRSYVNQFDDDGLSTNVRVEIRNAPVEHVPVLHFTDYVIDGNTPLFDSVGKLIEMFKTTPDYSNPDVTFLVMAITDGEENASRKYKHTLGQEIRRLQATDRWTFVFRVPRGYAANLEHLGIPAGNILEWEATERGMRDSSIRTMSAIGAYYGNVTRGITSTTQFYTTNLAGVSSNKVASAMKDLSDEVAIYPVKNKADISSFITLKTKQAYRKGTGFYQLSKTEKAVQDYKVLMVRNKNTGAVYGGGDARQILKLPTVGTFGLKPGDHGDWDIFVQSTSMNRVLLPGTSALYWENAR